MFPLCSAPAGDKLPASASAIVADRPRGHHELVIDGRVLDADVPAGVALSSAPFTVGGIRWRVVCYPNNHPLLLKREGDSPYTPPRTPTEVPFFYELVLDEDVAKPVRARFKFSVEVEQKQQQRKRSLFFLNSKPKPKVPFEFKSSEGARSFVHKDNYGGSNFRRSSLGDLLRRHGADRFTIRCEVVLINGFRTEEPPPVAASTLASIPPSDLHENLSALLLSGVDADLVIQVEGETFAGHRCVLAARCPVICRELLAGAAKDEGGDTAGVVRVDGEEPRVFRALLHYAYTDALPEMDVKGQDEGDMYRGLLVAADRYNLVRLKLICEEKLCRRVVDAGAAKAMLALAERHHCDGLKKACKDVLKNAPPAKQRALSSWAFVPFDGHKASN